MKSTFFLFFTLMELEILMFIQLIDLFVLGRIKTIRLWLVSFLIELFCKCQLGNDGVITFKL